MSETAKWRHLFIEYCKGTGIDIGYGGDAVVPTAMTFDRELSHPSHAKVGSQKQDFTGDAADMSRFRDNTFDYVYSSHCIEDFEDTKTVLKEWLRIVKTGGYMCLLFPDEKRYHLVSQGRNIDHKHEDMGIDYMVKNLTEVGNNVIIDQRYLFESADGTQPDYNCMIVVKKI